MWHYAVVTLQNVQGCTERILKDTPTQSRRVSTTGAQQACRRNVSEVYPIPQTSPTVAAAAFDATSECMSWKNEPVQIGLQLEHKCTAASLTDQPVCLLPNMPDIVTP